MKTQHDNLLWRGLKITLKNGNNVEIVHDYPGSLEKLLQEWLKAEGVKEQWAFLEFLNKKWKGTYAAFSMAHFKFISMEPQHHKEEKWSYAYFEMSTGGSIDIMHTLQGPNKDELITGAIEEWFCNAKEYTEEAFLKYFNQQSGYKAMSRKDYVKMN